MQACLSKAIPRHGDGALAINVVAFQEDSGFGKSWDTNAFSDAHDVVLVPLCLYIKGTHSTTAQPKKTEQPERPETNRDSSAAQPAPYASMDPDIEAVQPPCPMPTRAVPGAACTSTAQPAEFEQPHQPETKKDSSAAQPASSTFSAVVGLPPGLERVSPGKAASSFEASATPLSAKETDDKLKLSISMRCELDLFSILAFVSQHLAQVFLSFFFRRQA